MSYEPTEWVKGTKITATKLNNIEQGVQSVNSEYTPTTWAEGDIVTATKLNNIEQGIANASGGGGGDLEYSTWEVVINCPAIADEIINIVPLIKYENNGEIERIVAAGISDNNICNYITIPITNGLTDYTQKIAASDLITSEDSLTIQMNAREGYTASTTGNIAFQTDPDSGWLFFVTGNGTITITQG